MEGKTKRASAGSTPRVTRIHMSTKDYPGNQEPTWKKKLYIESYGCQMNFLTVKLLLSFRQRRIQQHKESGRGRFSASEYMSIRDKAEQTAKIG